MLTAEARLFKVGLLLPTYKGQSRLYKPIVLSSRSG
jgi:hypothetical protein